MSDGEESKGVETRKNINEIRATLLEKGFELLDPIGNGGFATVFTVRSLRYDQIFCVKIIDTSGKNRNAENLIDSFNAELDVLMKLTHPNVVSIFYHFASENCYYLILEYCPNGSIKDVLQREEKLEGDKLKDWITQLLKGMAYIHSQKICHRDIKPQNILVDQYDRPKIVDFGLAQLDGSMTRFCGSLPYMSPELVAKKPDSDPYFADVWALGITFYYMVFGTTPWSKKLPKEIAAEIVSGCIMIPGNVDPNLAQLLRKMLDVDPKKRGSMESLLEMPYFQQREKNTASPGSAESVLLTPLQNCALFTSSRANQQPANAQISGVFSKKRSSKTDSDVCKSQF